MLLTTNGPCYCWNNLYDTLTATHPSLSPSLPPRSRSAPASPASSSKLAFASGAVGTASALGYVFARPLQAKETIPCTPQNCAHVQEQRASSPSPHHHTPHHTQQACHVHKRFRLFRQKHKCPVHGSTEPHYILPPSTVHPLVVHPDKILPDPPTPPPRSSSLHTFRLSAPSPAAPPPTNSSSSRISTPAPEQAATAASGALPLPGRLFTKHSNRTEHSFLGLSSSFSSSRLSSFSTCSSNSSHSTSATAFTPGTTPGTTPSSSFAQGSDIELFMNEHHRTSKKKKSHSNSHVHQPAPRRIIPSPPLKCSCDWQNRSSSPIDTRSGGGGASPRPSAAPSAQSRLRRIWRDSNLFQWPRTTTRETSSRASHGTCTGSSSLSPSSCLATPYATASLPASSKVVASPSGRLPASPKPFPQRLHHHHHPHHHHAQLRHPYPAHTYDHRNVSPYISDEGNHSISEHEEDDDEEDDDDFALGRTAAARNGVSFQHDADGSATDLPLRAFPEGERLESELDRFDPEPLPRKALVEDDDDDEDEDWDIQSDAGAPSSSPMYAAGAAQPASFSTVTLPLNSQHHPHHHHLCQSKLGKPFNGSMRSRQRCVSLPVEQSSNRQHGEPSALSGSLGNRGMLKLPSLPSENWDEDFEIEAEDINVPTQVVETQISLQMDIYNIKDFALQIEDLKTLRASLRTASRSLRAKNPNKHQHLSTLFKRDWEQAEVIIDLGEIAQTQTQPSPASTLGAAPKTKAPSRRSSMKRLSNDNKNNNSDNTGNTRVVSASSTTTVAPAPLAPHESAWKRLSRRSTGSSTRNGVTSPAMSVDSPLNNGSRQEYFSPVESIASPLASPSDMDSIIQDLSVSGTFTDAAAEVENDGNEENYELDEEEEDDDLVDDGYESFSYSYSFMDGPITGVVSPIPTDRHMQVLKDILVEGLGQEVAQQFVFKNGEQDHVKFSVEVIPGLLNHLKGLQRRLSDQLLEFKRCEGQQQQQQQQHGQLGDHHQQAAQEIDRNQRSGRAPMGASDRSIRERRRSSTMRPALGDLGLLAETTTTVSQARTLMEVENEAESTIEPVAV